MDSTIRLHVWPSHWELPSTHPQCLAAILYAQIAIPGKFEVHECTNPDSSPNGLLPYLTHGLTALSSLPSIIKYISGLKDANLDASLSELERAQKVAWTAFIEAHIGDFVYCSFYAIQENYDQCTRPAMASKLPLPQRYYLPDRIREAHKPRLEAAGLWDVNVEKKQDGQQEHRRAAASLLQHRVQQTFAKEKVLTKARADLDILKNLLGARNYIFNEGPTSLDVLLAAHIILLTEVPFPNDALCSLIEQSYTSLHAHAKRIYTAAFGGPERAASPLSTSVSFLGPVPEPASAPRPPPLRVVQSSQQSITAVIPQLLPLQNLFSRTWTSRRPPEDDDAELDKEEKEAREKAAAEERAFARMRWAWTGLAVAGIVGWAMLSDLRFEFIRMDKDEAEEGDDEYVGDGEGEEVEIDEDEEDEEDEDD